MSSNKGGVAFVVIIILLVSASFAYILTSPTGGGFQPSKSAPKYTQYFNLGADAAGWQLNNNASIKNPVLNVGADTKVYFNITEVDGAPHNLYLAYDGAYSSSLFAKLVSAQTSNPKSIEGSSNYQVLSVSQITQTIGHKSQGDFVFGSASNYAGIYTYWCSIHYETMVGLLIVNATASTSSTVLVPLNAPAAPAPQANMPITYVASSFNGVLALNSVDTVE